MSISVVIPAYNSAAFLGETLRSVLAQTLRADEILVVDDGSTDGTAAVAEAFGSAVRVFRRPNQGVSAARNFGVEMAKGEWVAFLDADDLWRADKLALQMEALASDPGADLSYCARLSFAGREGGHVYGEITPVPPADCIRKALHCNTTFLPSAVVIRRRTYLAAGGFDTTLRIAQDWDLWLRLLHRGVRFVGVEQALLLYRDHPGSLSHNALPTLQELKSIYRRHVLPHLPWGVRWVQHQKSQSGQEAVAAYVLRSCGDPRHMEMMATSILRFPFNNVHRYKVLLHMVATQLVGLRSRPAEQRAVVLQMPGTRSAAVAAQSRDSAA